MKIISVGSSSSGNAYIINTGSKVIVLDAGLSCIKITRTLEKLGLGPEDVSAILVTHEHSDHVKSVRTLTNKCTEAFVYASRGTIENCSVFKAIDDERIRIIGAGEEAEDGDVKIRAYSLSHDASEPIGYSVIEGGVKLSVVTDTGVVTDEIYDEISDADMLVLEANHDEHLLMYGEYPYHLKQRIKSDAGHLSNRAAGELLAELLSERSSEGPLPVMLAHLSFHNNAPFQARTTIEDTLKEAGFESGKDYILQIASRDEMTSMSEL